MVLRLWVHFLLLYNLAKLIYSLSFFLYFDFEKQNFDHIAYVVFYPVFFLLTSFWNT